MTGDSHVYQYDELDRLNNEVNNGAEIGYQYDENGNRLLRNEANQTSVYGITLGSNQLEAIDNQLLTYDDAGHLIRDAQGRSFNYNNAGRLAVIQQNGVTVAEYRYQGNGLRSHKLMGAAVVIHYHYDPLGNLISETNADGSARKDYVWLGNEPVAQINSSESGETLNYLHTDHLNTPRLATDAGRAVTWRWESKAFGDSRPQSFGATVNLRFPGQYYDAESGFYYNWHRYYDSATGRYISSDPVGLPGGLNIYMYVDANPLSNIDPLGLARNRNRNAKFRPVNCRRQVRTECEAMCANRGGVKSCKETKGGRRIIINGEPVIEPYFVPGSMSCECNEDDPGSGQGCPIDSLDPQQPNNNFGDIPDWVKFLPLIPILTPWPDPY